MTTEAIVRSKSPADTLKTQGVNARRGASEVAVDIADVWIPPRGHVLYHPRQKDPIDPALRYDIAKRGVKEALVLWRMGVFDGKMRLGLLDGCQRTNHLRDAIRMMLAGEPFAVYVDGVATGETELIQFKEGMQFVPVEFFSGDELQALFRRAASNSDPFKRPDAPSVLAVYVTQFRALRATDAQILAVMPRGIVAADLESLAQWADLTKEAAARFDAGAPLGLLGAVLAAPREEQLATLDKLVRAGLTTAKGATRLKNREARAESTGGNGERIRLPVIRRIVAAVAPTETEVEQAAAVFAEQKRAVIDEAYETMMAHVFCLGSRFDSGDLTVLDGLSPDLRRRIKAAHKKETAATAEKPGKKAAK